MTRAPTMSAPNVNAVAESCLAEVGQGQRASSYAVMK